MGAYDYINRPFDATIVHKRIANTLFLHARQRDLERAVQEEYDEHQRNNDLMITILSHIVEFRNGESGLHIQNVKTITELLLKRLVQITDKYPLSSSDISLITMVSAMHDIGKVSIPESILNKPGKLDPDEFAIMKTHSEIGSNTLASLPAEHFQTPMVKCAYEVCRWHHERYDGKGYPDGLKGEEIPISAQVVSVADVYDALTSERCYKKAFSHEVALKMILEGQCGTFNPILLQCLSDISDKLKEIQKVTSNANPSEGKGKGAISQLHKVSSSQPDYMQLLYVDSLTKVYNRRYYKEYIRDISAFEAIAVISFDGFTKINETYGPDKSDSLLCRIAQMLLAQIRRNDYLIHYSADKFLIVFSKIPKQSFRIRLEEFFAILESLISEEYPSLQLKTRINGVYNTGNAHMDFRIVDDLLADSNTGDKQLTICYLDEAGSDQT